MKRPQKQMVVLTQQCIIVRAIEPHAQVVKVIPFMVHLFQHNKKHKRMPVCVYSVA